MAQAIGDTLPLGLGIALNPLAIVAGILILGKPDPGRNGAAFAAGWVLGLSALLLLAAFFVQDRLAAPFGVPSPWPSLVRLVLGLLLIAAAVPMMRRRPPQEGQAELPRWLRVLDRGGVARAFGAGLFLATVSLKNLALLAAAAGIIGEAGLGTARLVVAVALFVAIATTGILVPLLVHLFGGAGAGARLAAWRRWLTLNVGPITAVVMLLLGANLLGRGLGGVF